ncbi:hypothetical protein [Bacillus sp. FJAT-22090]|uniref:hypothetical protein n=1 Tax=Bacillus sp. FJAT-22090 TaxID=1581038 RepID=UPI0011A406F3|nr:hypothetical protein [Bacillus sp. FJAT-22090]
MKKVEVIKTPVRYKGTRYLTGESFEMNDDHVNESLVKVIDDVAKTSKSKEKANTKGQTESE